MRGLKNTILLKVFVTIVLWIIPSLFFPPSLNSRLGFPPFEAMVFIRLLGAAFAALCVGYLLGLGELKKGRYPAAAVRAGIVSNGGAALILAIYGLGGHWQNWGAPARIYMWISLIAVCLVTAGLFYFGVYNQYLRERSFSAENP